MLSGENSYLYNIHEFQKASAAPLSIVAKLGYEMHSNSMSPLSYMPYSRHVAATCKLVDRFTRRYQKPEFGLDYTVIEGKRYKVTEQIILEKPFGNLMHFERARDRKDPKMLIVAPMSGHFATLLRGTVEALLPFFDVYITDWEDAREIPLYEGAFHFDDYVDYVTDFIRLLGPEVHVMAVCQPAVPVMAAVSLMNDAKDPKAPASMTLIGGPIDTRINPTEVNQLAETRPLEWFRQNVITRVPFNYPGFMRRVYPGFIQLSGFMQMNLERHIGEHVKLFNHLVEGDGDSADAHKKFYNEYLAVMDLPAEFYLETLKCVFQDHSLPKGQMKVRGKKVDPSAIRHTALLTLEGELDDISGVGQTKAAQTLCKNLPATKRTHYMQKGVGHYGIFNGRKFREHVVPVIVEFAHKHEKSSTASQAAKEVARASSVGVAAANRPTVKSSAASTPKKTASAAQRSASVSSKNKPTAKKPTTAKAKPATAKKAAPKKVTAKKTIKPAAKASAKATPKSKAPTKTAPKASKPAAKKTTAKKAKPTSAKAKTTAKPAAKPTAKTVSKPAAKPSASKSSAAKKPMKKPASSVSTNAKVVQIASARKPGSPANNSSGPSSKNKA